MGWTLAEAAEALFCGTCGDLHNYCSLSPLYGKADDPAASRRV